MNDSPIRRKKTAYPRDFLPPPTNTLPQTRFTFNNDYHIQPSTIRKYQQSIEQKPTQSHLDNTNTHNHGHPTPQIATSGPNPEKGVLSAAELEPESPLVYHLTGKLPGLDQDLLSKPRFSLNDKQEMEEKGEAEMQSEMSPGCIRKQLENRQVPLPLEPPCKIELMQGNASKNRRITNSYLKYSSGRELEGKRWMSSEKEVIDNRFKGNSGSRLEELPKVGRKSGQGITQGMSVTQGMQPTQGMQSDGSFRVAKQQYDSFRRNQNPNHKMTSMLTSLNNKQGLSATELPSFNATAVDKLKGQINNLVRSKKGIPKKHESSSQSHSEEEDDVRQSRNTHKNKTKSKKTSFRTKAQADSRPELLVSYRSSLSYLKDLHAKSANLSSYHLIVKIPKLFNQKLIFKEQQRQHLYQTARSIFSELKIPHENLIIKKYTNCTMLVARNICMIWHFDGRRYLGGWQAEYLDQGCKHGLGLEWEPKKYVYYGEYLKNKKHGLGIYKDSSEANYIGYWRRGQRGDREGNDSSLDEIEEEQAQNGYYDGEEDEEGEEQDYYDSSQNYQYL